MASKNADTYGITIPGPEIYPPGHEISMPGTGKVSGKRRKSSAVKKITVLLAAGLSVLPVGISSCADSTAMDTVSVEETIDTSGN